MNIITKLNFNKKKCSFNVNGIGYELDNASQYADKGQRFKWKNPQPNRHNERFVPIGDGNLIYSNDLMHYSEVFIILSKVNENTHYTLKHEEFLKTFELD